MPEVVGAYLHLEAIRGVLQRAHHDARVQNLRPRTRSAVRNKPLDFGEMTICTQSSVCEQPHIEAVPTNELCSGVVQALRTIRTTEKNCILFLLLYFNILFNVSVFYVKDVFKVLCPVHGNGHGSSMFVEVLSNLINQSIVRIAFKVLYPVHDYGHMDQAQAASAPGCKMQGRGRNSCDSQLQPPQCQERPTTYGGTYRNQKRWTGLCERTHQQAWGPRLLAR